MVPTAYIYTTFDDQDKADIVSDREENADDGE